MYMDREPIDVGTINLLVARTQQQQRVSCESPEHGTASASTRLLVVDTWHYTDRDHASNARLSRI